MPPFIPTSREIGLLAILLVFLLYASSSFKATTLTVSDIVKLRSNTYSTDEDTDGKPVTFESKYSLQALNTPLHWGLGQVPQTQILAHVPGMCSSFCPLWEY